MGVERSSTAAKKHGLPDEAITYLAERTELDPARIKLRSTRENVTAAFADLAKRAKVNDEIIVLLIGHGTFDGKTAAFNLPGPDLTAADYAKLLEKFPTQRIAFIHTGSSSGAFVPVLAGPARTIVAATRTGGERNETRFPEYFVAGARRRRGRPRPQRPRVDPRGVRLRQEPGRRVVREGRPPPDRARDARRWQRGQVRVDAVPGAAAIALGRDGEGRSEAARRWSRSATRSIARSPRCGCGRIR